VIEAELCTIGLQALVSTNVQIIAIMCRRARDQGEQECIESDVPPCRYLAYLWGILL